MSNSNAPTTYFHLHAPGVGEPKRRNWTTLAKNYGHPYKKISGINYRVLKNTGKSGITPLSPFRVNGLNFTTIAQREQKNSIYWTQRERFFSFTAVELRVMEALSALNPIIYGRLNLNNSIHGAFARSQWLTHRTHAKHLGFVPMLGLNNGHWTVDNDVVWNLLEQPLKLASLLLDNASFWPWWDALFNGEYREIEPWRRPVNLNAVLQSFHNRDPTIWSSGHEGQKLQNQIKDVAKNIRFGLFSGYTQAYTNFPDRSKDSANFGLTTDYSTLAHEYITCYLSIGMLQPMLRSDLTDAEWLTMAFRVAATLIHEFAHAIWNVILTDHQSIDDWADPFYELENLSELGWSLEDKLWGGEPRDMIPNHIHEGGRGLGNMGFLKTNWFTDLHTKNQTWIKQALNYNTPLVGPDPYKQYEYWPVPVQWQINLFQPEFWTKVRNIGAKATLMGPLTFGATRDSGSFNEANSYTPVTNRGFQDPHYFDVPFLGANMTDSEKAYKITEYERRQHAQRIVYLGQYIIINQPFKPIPTSFSGAPTSNDSGTDSDSYSSGSETSGEDIDPWECPPCPRWDGITQYLFNNRGPLELALDTMDFDIPESNLYRYIEDRGGLAGGITPLEFRNFLICAHTRGELFEFYMKDVRGVVRRIDAGWPVNNNQYPINRRAHPSANDMSSFHDIITSPVFRKSLWVQYRGFKDIDYEGLRRWLNFFLHRNHGISGNMEDIVFQFATNNSGLLSLGPKGIARITVQVSQDIKDEVEESEKQTSYESESSHGSSSHGGSVVRSGGLFDGGSRYVGEGYQAPEARVSSQPGSNFNLGQRSNFSTVGSPGKAPIEENETRDSLDVENLEYEFDQTALEQMSFDDDSDT